MRHRLLLALVGIGLVTGAAVVAEDRLSGCPEREGRVVVTVIEATGGVIPDVTVVLQHPLRRKKLRTNTFGRTEACMPPGDSRLRIDVPGFKKFDDRVSAEPARLAEKTVMLEAKSGCVVEVATEPRCVSGPLPPPLRGYRWCGQGP